MIDCFCQPIKSDVGCVNGKGWNTSVGSRGGGYVFVFASVCVWIAEKICPFSQFMSLSLAFPSHDRP